MVNNIMTAHNFAHNIKPNLKSSNMFWERETRDGDKRSIYSYGYHFCIAYIDDNKKTALYSTRTYSNSTAKHQNDTFSALCNNYNIIMCHDAGGSVLDNLKHYIQEIIKYTGKVARARKYATTYAKRIENIYNDAKQYAGFFDLNKRTFAPVEKVYQIYKSAAAVDALNIMQKEQTKQEKREHAAQLRKQRERERIAALESARRVQLWESGKKVYLSYNDTANNVPLRFITRKNYTCIETGKGVIVPLLEAQRIAPIMLTDDVEQIKQLKVNDVYTLCGFDSDIIKFGCHTFNKKYLFDWCKKVLNL